MARKLDDIEIWLGSSGIYWWPIPFDPTGFAFEWIFSGSDGQTAFTLTATTENGGLVVDSTNRQLGWVYTEQQTAVFPIGRLSDFEIWSIEPGDGSDGANGARAVEAYGLAIGMGSLIDGG